VLSGLLLDKIGSRKSNILFISLQFIGLSVSALATSANFLDFQLFLIGQSVFGMGNVGTMIWFTTVNSVFFYFDHNATSMAVLVWFTAIGDCLANNLMPVFYKSSGSICYSMLFPIMFQIISLVAIIVINRIEKLSATKRKGLRYARVVTRKVDEVTSKLNLVLKGRNESESQSNMSSFINQNGMYFAKLRKIVQHP